MSMSKPVSSPEPRSRPVPYHDPQSPDSDARDVPVEVLVRHLLAAKQSLSSMALVLRAHDLVTNARQMHEDSVILSAQAGSVRELIQWQMQLLRKVRRVMGRAYDHGRREFNHLIRTLDAVNGQLEQTMEMLRSTQVERVFRPPGEAEKCLMDFVDENSVETMRDALKGSIAELQAAQTFFDGDLLRFDRDLQLLDNAMFAALPPASTSTSLGYEPIPHLLASLSSHSHVMAELLTSLTKHFDMCVKAVRATEGGAALARRRAAEATGDGDPVSISGVITEQESHLRDLDPMDPQDLAEIVEVVVHDAPEVDDVVAEIQGVLQQMELDFGMLKEEADKARATYMATMAAFQALEDISSRFPSYVAARSEFEQRWENEKEIIGVKVREMDAMRRFYEGYASAYGSLLLEAERRRAVEDKIQNTLRKAKENVDKLVQADRQQREHFRQEVGEFLPTDLWVGMNDPLKRWELVPVTEEAAPDTGPRKELKTPTLDQPAAKGKAPVR